MTTTTQQTTTDGRWTPTILATATIAMPGKPTMTGSLETASPYDPTVAGKSHCIVTEYPSTGQRRSSSYASEAEARTAWATSMAGARSRGMLVTETIVTDSDGYESITITGECYRVADALLLLPEMAANAK